MKRKKVFDTHLKEWKKLEVSEESSALKALLQTKTILVRSQESYAMVHPCIVFIDSLINSQLEYEKNGSRSGEEKTGQAKEGKSTG